MNGGEIIAKVLKEQHVPFIFTLCGGHISPILVGCKQHGIRVIDTRHEATAVFAADATARMTGIPGVAVVTAGPGTTNTITAIQNAKIAQSPIVLIAGAVATKLKGRGALQDIDQIAIFKPVVKWAKAVRRIKNLGPVLKQAFQEAQKDVPGPVFIECPIDLLYDESLVRDWYNIKSKRQTLMDSVIKYYLDWHVNRLFAGSTDTYISPRLEITPLVPNLKKMRKVAKKLQQVKRPILLAGSQALLNPSEANNVAAAVERLGLPVYLSGMARGLLGKCHPLQMFHQRRVALKKADFVILAGVPCDFRLDYGNHINRRAFLISANRSYTELTMNRRPNIGVLCDPGLFLQELAKLIPTGMRWSDWQAHLRQGDEKRYEEIKQQALEATGKINPIHLCIEIENSLSPTTILIADGGDFVATASYIVRPSGPLTWLDPGVFGTLGVGAGFALSAKLCHPEASVWIIYGDGAVGYSLSEFDTFVRHQIPVIAVVGNDAGWTQIAREQIEIFKDNIGTKLLHTNYHHVVEGFGGKGFLLDDPKHIKDVLKQAKQAAANNRPVLINAILGKTDFRKGSISM